MLAYNKAGWMTYEVACSVYATYVYTTYVFLFSHK